MKIKLIAASIAVMMMGSCKPAIKQAPEHSQTLQDDSVGSEYVLAQWTFNKALFAGDMTTFDFVNKAADMGFVGVEYVNQFFREELENESYLRNLASLAKERGIKNTLLMVDLTDVQLGDADAQDRQKAIDLHKKWIVAASQMDCPTIRVNAFGSSTGQAMFDNMFESVKELLSFGKKYGVSVIIENHGRFSSDADWLVRLVEELVPYGGGSLADFDNWCIEREGGAMWGAPCIKEYDRYEGMQKLLPTARSVSLKAFDFDGDGDAIKTDFKRMFELIKAAQYDEYLAVEFEGHDMDPIEGIRKTLELCRRYDANAPKL